MLSKDHMEISFYSALFLFTFLYLGCGGYIVDNFAIHVGIIIYFGVCCSFLIGIFIGSLLPDTDIPNSKIDYINNSDIMCYVGYSKNWKLVLKFFISIICNITLGVGKLTKHILNPVIVILLQKILNKQINKNHRGITHSICGIFGYCLLLEGIGLIILTIFTMLVSEIFGYIILYYSLLIFGILFGGILHLLEDMCTVSGVIPFYPFYENQKFSGKLRTGDLNDKYPKYFKIIISSTNLIMILVLLFIISKYFGGNFKSQSIMIMMFGVISFIVSWAIILSISKVKHTYLTKV
jgi:membrane-bound metal-dependent hydrolase YbcI (DUF457 family)